MGFRALVSSGFRGFVCGLRVFVLLGPMVIGRDAQAASPIQYIFSFPEPEHRWMQIDATFPDLAPAPLELRMSRSSPGRYSIHDFAKNVYDVHVIDGDGRELALTRPDAHGWTVESHGSRVTVRYKVYGDLIDGTYLAVDASHAHINMPAVVMWARGLDDRPFTVKLVAPTSANWKVATQLHTGSSLFEFTAPNLSYLMDSPIEFGPLAIREFTTGGRTFRFAAHHRGGDGELDDFVKDVEKIVRQTALVFGEYPMFEPGAYTFVGDYLPYATSDGMEHRNSTVMTSPGSIRGGRRELLETVSHEFFHTWNVERIRPRSIEPFDLERANMSAELWLAEGFTQYYGSLLLHRAGITDMASTADALTEFVDPLLSGPWRFVRSAEDMSRMAVFVDGGTTVDRTNWTSTYLSYYPFGGAIALALDLTLRDRSDSRLTLDDFMRAMWRVHGKPGGAREGAVDHPYTAADAEARLAEVAGDASFAANFFDRYIRGHEAADYARLLARAGLALRPRSPGRAWWGDVTFEQKSGRVSISGLLAATWPAYDAGLEQDDEIRQMDGMNVRAADEITNILSRKRPGERVSITYVDRTATEKTTTVTLTSDPHVEVVPMERAGVTLTPAQRTFRDRWLAGK